MNNTPTKQKQKIVSYRKNGRWYKFDGETLPDTVEAVELRSTMTIEEFEKLYPERNIKALLQPRKL